MPKVTSPISLNKKGLWIAGVILLLLAGIVALVVSQNPSKEDYTVAQSKVEQIEQAFTNISQLSEDDSDSGYGGQIITFKQNIDALKAAQADLKRSNIQRDKDFRTAYDEYEQKVIQGLPKLEEVVGVFSKIENSGGQCVLGQEKLSYNTQQLRSYITKCQSVYTSVNTADIKSADLKKYVEATRNFFNESKTLLDQGGTRFSLQRPSQDLLTAISDIGSLLPTETERLLDEGRTGTLTRDMKTIFTEKMQP